MLVRPRSLNCRGFRGTIQPSFYRLSLGMLAGELQPVPAASALEVGGQSPARCRASSTRGNATHSHLRPVWSHQWAYSPNACLQADGGCWSTQREHHRHRESATQKGPRNLLPGAQEPSAGNSPNYYRATLFINIVKTIYKEKLDFFPPFWLSQDDTGPLQSLLRFLPQRDQLLPRFSKSSKLVSPIYHQKHPLTCMSSSFFTKAL